MAKLKLLLLIFMVMFLKISSSGASSLSVSQNLSFGTLIPVSNSGSVIVSTAGAINVGGAATVAPSGTSYYQGIVRFTPTILDVFTFSVINSSITLSSGSGTVIVDNFTINPATLSINILAPSNVNIGGRMTFSSASPAGTYNGTVTVRANSLLGGTRTTSLPVTLTLWSKLAMSETVQMSFGSIEVNSGSSVIRINPQSGIRSIISGAGNANLGSSPAATAGQFAIYGQSNTAVSVALPSAITLSGNKGGTMTVNNFSGYPSSTTMTLSGTGNGTLYVGADLNINSAQTSGTYSGTYSVTVNY